MLNTIKWLGTACVVASVVFRVTDYHVADMAMGVFGGVLWTYAGIRMKDHALVTVNGFIMLVLLYGILK